MSKNKVMQEEQKHSSDAASEFLTSLPKQIHNQKPPEVEKTTEADRNFEKCYNNLAMASSRAQTIPKSSQIQS